MHCCLAAFYIDDFGYQENILPRIHKNQGHVVTIVASTETYIGQVGIGYIEPSSYTSSDGIVVTRLPYVTWLPASVARKLRLYQGLSEQIDRFDPDIIFLHDCQFFDIGVIAKRAARSGTSVYVDCHTDFVNSGRSWLSRNVLHKLLYRWCARRIDPWTRKFFATLPVRGDFLRDVYGISASKIELLPFGVDDSRVKFEELENIRDTIRRQLGIRPGQLTFVSGGKIDARKNIDVLIKAFVARSNSGDLDNAVLILFGTPEARLAAFINEVSKHPGIRYVGWIPASDVYKFLWAADVAVFPGTHSVLWEEAVGLGLPCVFKRWSGIEHIDLDGNCIMLDTIDEAILGQVLAEIAASPEQIHGMKKVAMMRGREMFSYTHIARRALCLE